VPTGLALQLDGTLTGTPREKGRFRFFVEMREPQNDPGSCAGKRTQKEFTIWVREPASIVAMPASPPLAEVGVPLRIRLRARGGSGVFAWASIGGRLPEGLRLRRGGLLAGVPRRAGTYHLEVSARDTEARVARWPATLHIARRLVLGSGRVPPARVGRPYAVTIQAGGGITPRTWRLVRGPLPRGVELLPGGRLVGTPRRAGRYRVVVRVRDALGVRATATLTVDVRR
jgi:large repetitive protein